MVQLKCFDGGGNESPLPRFNSCMVQLKWRKKISRFILIFCFNSCMVQLKSEEISYADDTTRGFNSCMVQLK